MSRQALEKLFTTFEETDDLDVRRGRGREGV